MKKIIIIDGHSIIFKIYFSLIRTPLITKKGENVTILHGFLNKLFSIIDKFQPDFLGIIFDSKEKTFRHGLYKEYKANRSKAPDEINRQSPILLTLLSDLGFYVKDFPGYEADDIIAHIAHSLELSEEELYIYSADKDLMQLIDKNVFMLSSVKGEREEKVIDREGVYEKFSLYPEQISDYLSLVGDSSDNVPGVRGIGEVSAKKLLQKYKTLDNLYEYLHTVDSKSTKDKLAQGKDMAYLSKKLVTLDRDLPFEINIKDFGIPGSYTEKALENLKKHELKSIYEKLSGKSIGIPVEYNTIDNSQYRLINSLEDLTKFREQLPKEKNLLIAFDTETNGIDFKNMEIFGCSFSYKENTACYIPLLGDNRAVFLPIIKEILESGQFNFIGHNIKFDYKVMRHYGISIKNVYFDTMIAGKLIIGDTGKINMDYLAEKFLRYKTIHYSDIVQDKNLNLSDYPLDQVKDYACEDADITLRLFNLFKNKIEDFNLSKLFYLIEMPLVRILAEMEIQGIKIDPEYFKNKRKFLEEQISNFEREIYTLAGEEFLIKSPKQLQTILFEKLNLPPVKTGKTGYSTDERVLEQLSAFHELPGKIIEYRKLTKLNSTYVEPLLKYIDNDNSIHTTYNQVFVTTGRLSSSEPNLQNIPVKDEFDINIRGGFVSSEGKSFISADYSQIELRVLAYFCKDKTLAQSFRENQDIHNLTASLIFNKPQESISKDERKIAKTINFGVIYGLSPFGLSQQLNIPRSQAQIFISLYFQKFSDIKTYEEKLVSFVKEKGYTYTLFGRRRYIPELKSSNKTDQQMGTRLALNSQIQGTAAEIMKLAMIHVDKRIKSQFSPANVKILLQIHDEIILEVDDGILQECREIVKTEMESIPGILRDWNIPLIANISTGKNWGELK